MTKKELDAAVQTAKERTRQALQTVYDALNQGQRKKILGQESVAALMELYKVEL